MQTVDLVHIYFKITIGYPDRLCGLPVVLQKILTHVKQVVGSAGPAFCSCSNIFVVEFGIS